MKTSVSVGPSTGLHFPTPVRPNLSPSTFPAVQNEQAASSPSAQQTAQPSRNSTAAQSGLQSASNAQSHVLPRRSPAHTAQYTVYSVRPYGFLQEHLPPTSRYTPANWYGPHPNHSPSLSSPYVQQMPGQSQVKRKRGDDDESEVGDAVNRTNTGGGV